MKVKVILFAAVREQARTAALELEMAEPVTAAAVRQALLERIPAAAELIRRSMLAVNEEYAPNTMVIPPGAEVACIPPVSGGAGPRDGFVAQGDVLADLDASDVR